MQLPKRLIEVDLPIARISAHSRREKSIRHGHISTLHIWWARRPLAACRAVVLASLWPDPVDLSGWFLTDDLDAPDQWAFPAGTVLEPGDYLLVWTDGEPDQGPLHASFRLDSDGEELALLAPEGDGQRLVDAVTFPALEADVSWGRIQDGDPTWTELDVPTPGASNGRAPREPTGRIR